MRVMLAYKADPALIEQLDRKEEGHELKVGLVSDSAAKLLDRDGCIRKISILQKDIETSSGAELKPWFIGKVLRKHLDLKYSKVRKVPFQANF